MTNGDSERNPHLCLTAWRDTVEHQNAEYYKVILGRTDYLNMASVQLMHTNTVFFHVPFICPTFAVFCFLGMSITLLTVLMTFKIYQPFLPMLKQSMQLLFALEFFMEATILIHQTTDGYGRYSFTNHGDPSCTQSIYNHP